MKRVVTFSSFLLLSFLSLLHGKEKLIPSNETVVLLDSLPSLSSNPSVDLNSFLVPQSSFPSLYSFQIKYLKAIDKIVEANEGETLGGNLTRLSPTTWLWTSFDVHGKKHCGGDDYFVSLEVEGKREWGEDGEWESTKKFNHPVAMVTDNMDGTYIFDFSDLSCSVGKGKKRGEDGREEKKEEKQEKEEENQSTWERLVAREREKERERGEVDAEIHVLLQHSQGNGLKFFPKKKDCLLGCSISRILHREKISLSSLSSPSPSSSLLLSAPFLPYHIYQRDKLENGTRNENYIPFLAHFSHIYIAGDSIALQMHTSLQKMIHFHLGSPADSAIPLSPRLPSKNPDPTVLESKYYPKITLHSGDLRMMLLSYSNSPFQRYTKKISTTIHELAKNEKKRQREFGREKKGGLEGWEGWGLNETRDGAEGVAVVINTGLWNLLGDSRSEVLDPLYSHHLLALSQWILDLKRMLPKGAKLFYREMFAPQIHRVRCDLNTQPHCHNRVKYLTQSRGKYLASLQNLIMKQHGVQVLGVYHTSNEGTTQEGDGRHYTPELYNRLWRSWGSVGDKWVTVAPCHQNK